jgi:hypothetical protein
MHTQKRHGELDIVNLPSPTAMPIVLALGIAFMVTAFVTNIYIGLLGLVLAVWASVGWFFEVLPHEKHVAVPIEAEEVEVFTSRALRERLPISDLHRKFLPIETFRISTGIRGGIAGGIAMIVPAAIFSLVRYHSLWYAANLLAAGGFVNWVGASDAFLSQFHLEGLLAALAIHGATSVLVGLLYGAMLPMYPRHPIVTAGLVVPLLFTGILHSGLGIVSPILNERIDWPWFFISLIAFGLVCGYVVNLHAKVRTPQFRALPFAIRAGIHGDIGVTPPQSVDDSDKGDSGQ